MFGRANKMLKSN